MKSSSHNTTTHNVRKDLSSWSEKPWSIKPGGIAILVLIGTLLCAGVYFTLPTSARQTSSYDSNLPEELGSQLKHGTLLFEQGQLDSAENLYKQLIVDFPSYPQGYNNLAALHAFRGELDQARVLLEQSMATNSDYAAIYRNLGMIYAELARDSYGRALQLESGDMKAQLQILDTQGTAQLVAAKNKVASVEKVATSQVETAASVKEPVITMTTEKGSVAESKTEPMQTAKIALVPTSEQKPQPVSIQESPEEFMNRWANAWSAQDASTYLGLYSGDYLPRNYKTRSSWEKKRRSRIIQPAYVQVSLENFKIISSTEDDIELELIQSYKNDRFQDKTRKRFELTRTDQSWAITRERSLGSIN